MTGGDPDLGGWRENIAEKVRPKQGDGPRRLCDGCKLPLGAPERPWSVVLLDGGALFLCTDCQEAR